MQIRTGLGYDVHKFGKGRFIMLGGHHIDCDFGIIAHSDGDVVLHALCDAIYGSIGEGDIGTHFPPSDEQWRNTPSVIFLEHALGRLSARGFLIANVDATVVAERPKVQPHRDEICKTLAKMLSLEPDQVSIKATTHEKMGAFGRGEGIAAMVSILVYKD